jgi:hypothetical protein
MRFLCGLLSIFALAACGRADAKTTDRPSLTVEYFQQDSARVIARWARPCDSKGCADSYRVQWTAGAVTRTVTKTVPIDTLRVLRPAVGDSLSVSVSVTSVRRAISGASRSAAALVRNPDAPPPPVDSLRADTTNYAERADSVRTEFLTLEGVRLAEPITLLEGDSVLMVARYYLPAGTVRHPKDTTEWSVINGTAVIRVHPVRRGWRDSAYLAAVSCGCRESGDPENPPRLDMRSGQYVVRDGNGYRPVTPLSADPFR